MARPLTHTARELDLKYKAYLRDLRDNPWTIQEPIKSGIKAGEIVEYKRVAPKTIAGFCSFADIDERTFHKWQTPEFREKNPEFGQVASRIWKAIRRDQIEGGQMNLYNANLTARLNNLTDNLAVEHTGEQQSINIQIDTKGSKLE